MAKLVDLKEYREKKELSRLLGELSKYRDILDDYDCPKFPDSIIESFKIHQEWLEQFHGDQVRAVLEWHNPQSK